MTRFARVVPVARVPSAGPCRLQVRLHAPHGAAWVDAPAILRTAIEGAAVTDDDVAIVAELAAKTVSAHDAALPHFSAP